MLDLCWLSLREPVRMRTGRGNLMACLLEDGDCFALLAMTE